MSRSIFPQSDKITPRLMSTRQAAEYLCMSPTSIKRLYYSGVIKAIASERRLRYDVRDLDRWVEENKQ